MANRPVRNNPASPYIAYRPPAGPETTRPKLTVDTNVGGRPLAQRPQYAQHITESPRTRTPLGSQASASASTASYGGSTPYGSYSPQQSPRTPMSSYQSYSPQSPAGYAGRAAYQPSPASQQFNASPGLQRSNAFRESPAAKFVAQNGYSPASNHAWNSAVPQTAQLVASPYTPTGGSLQRPQSPATPWQSGPAMNQARPSRPGPPPYPTSEQAQPQRPSSAPGFQFTSAFARPPRPQSAPNLAAASAQYTPTRPQSAPSGERSNFASTADKPSWSSRMKTGFSNYFSTALHGPNGPTLKQPAPSADPVGYRRPSNTFDQP